MAKRISVIDYSPFKISGSNIVKKTAANTFTSDITGNVIGNVTGAVQGNVIGNITGACQGNVIGNLTGDVKGNVIGNITGAVQGNVIGNITGACQGNVIGNLTGDVLGTASTATLATTATTAVGLSATAWSAWTPIFAGLTAGSGTTVGKFTQIGKTVLFRISFLWAADTSAAATATYLTNLPVTANAYLAGQPPIGWLNCNDNNTGDHRLGRCTWRNSAEANLYTFTVDGTNIDFAAIHSAAPFTWAADDKLTIEGLYEAA